MFSLPTIRHRWAVCNRHELFVILFKPLAADLAHASLPIRVQVAHLLVFPPGELRFLDNLAHVSLRQTFHWHLIWRRTRNVAALSPAVVIGFLPFFVFVYTIGIIALEGVVNQKWHQLSDQLSKLDSLLCLRNRL